MYDELIKNLRICSRCDFGQDCNGCTQKSDDAFCCDKLLHQAADTIEELSREAEEYKAAYRKEHNKRIAENRHLYNEMTKAVRAKLLMTPLRIEMPEPPKAEEDE